MDYLRSIEHEELQYSQEAVSAVSKRARKVLNCLDASLADGSTVDSVILKRIVRRVSALVSNPVARRVLTAELGAMRGCSFSKQDRVLLACSVAGAVANAKQGGSVGVLSMDVPAVDCWARVQQVVVPETQQRTEEVINLQLLLCNSVLAGNSVWVEVFRSSVKRWARNLGLLGSRRNRLTLHSTNQFLDAVLILRVEKQGGQLSVHGGGYHPRVLEANTKLAKSRSRKHSACHFGATFDCGVCSVGRNQCERSCCTLITNFELGE